MLCVQTVRALWEERFEQLDVVLRKYGMTDAEVRAAQSFGTDTDQAGDSASKVAAAAASAASQAPYVSHTYAGAANQSMVPEVVDIALDSDDSDVVIVGETPAPSHTVPNAPRAPPRFDGRDDANPPGADGGAAAGPDASTASASRASAGSNQTKGDGDSFPLTHTLALLRAVAASTKRHGGAAPGARTPPALFRVSRARGLTRAVVGRAHGRRVGWVVLAPQSVAKAVQAQTGDGAYGTAEACRHWRCLLRAMDSLGGEPALCTDMCGAGAETARVAHRCAVMCRHEARVKHGKGGDAQRHCRCLAHDVLEGEDASTEPS